MPRPTFFNLPEDKRARVVEALKAEFAARPYARASVDRVIAAAGVSKGSFYQYFENKDDAYAHLVRELMSARVGLTGAPAPDAPFEEVLAAMQRTGAHLGRVLEPAGPGRGGRTIGVVFLEDILEELVGEVNDAMQREGDQRRDRD